MSRQEIKTMIWHDFGMTPEVGPWQSILNNIKPSPGYCALRQNRDSEAWWVDAGTFALSADECRAKTHKADQLNEGSRDFAAKNPALVILNVEVTPK